MKGNKIKIVTIILAIVLITLVGFFGIYVQVQNRMENQVKGYYYASDINGVRRVALTPSVSSKEIVKDSEGKEVENSESLTDDQIKEKGYTKEYEKYNPDDQMTLDNYKLTKNIIEKRLQARGVEDYTVRLEEDTGLIVVDIPENSNTDDIISSLTVISKFEILDDETNEVLMNNDDIKEVQVLYGGASSTSTGTSVFLSINFDKEGTKKLEEISKKYTPNANENEENKDNTTEENTSEGVEVKEGEEATNETQESSSEESNSKEKKIKMMVDDEEVLNTSFEEPITTGVLQLSYGKESTDNETIKQNAEKANKVAVILRNEKLPLKYEAQGNQYLLSEITEQHLQIIGISIVIVALLALIVLTIRYKTNGLLATISFIGLAAILLLTIRYANVILSIEGILAIVVVLILNYVFNNKILHSIKKENTSVQEAIKVTYKDFFIKIVPIIIMSIVFCFMNWTVINTFGMVMFWGISIIALYNYLVTGTLLKLKGGID